MSKLPIFTEASDGSLVRMSPSRPETEDSLQQLIATAPEVISGEDETLLLIKREIGIPGQIDGSDRWSLDHLFVTRSGIPVLVEIKRATDTRLRREVIGQIMDYAANGVAYWPGGALQATFEQSCELQGEDPTEALKRFLEGAPHEGFWDQVEANLRAGDIKLLIVADEIPDELTRIIEFLNDQMRATVMGVELKYFESDAGYRTLAPRLIGASEMAKPSQTRKPDLPEISPEVWIETYLAGQSAEIRAGAYRFIEIMRDLGADVGVSRGTHYGINAPVLANDGKQAWPVQLELPGRIHLQMRWLKYRPAFSDQSDRQSVLDEFKRNGFTLSTDNPNGYPGFSADYLSIEEQAAAFKNIMRDIVKRAKRTQMPE